MTVKWNLEIQIRNPVDENILAQMIQAICRMIAEWPIVIKVSAERIDKN